MRTTTSTRTHTTYSTETGVDKAAADKAKAEKFRQIQARHAEALLGNGGKLSQLGMNVATAVLRCFLIAEPYTMDGGAGVSRTSAAVEMVIETIPTELTVKCEPEIKKAIHRARWALRTAFDELREAEKTAKQASR